MSAREIHLTKNGDAETATFSIDTVPAKVAGPGEVVVKITTAPVNPADIFSIMGVCGFCVPMGRSLGLGWSAASTDCLRIRLGHDATGEFIRSPFLPAVALCASFLQTLASAPSRCPRYLAWRAPGS